MSVDRRLALWGETMAKLGAAFDKTLDQPQLDIYWEQLSDVNPSLLLEAALKWIKEQTRFPRIADLREYCDRVRPQQALIPAPTIDGEPTYHCPICQDREGAWESFAKYVEAYGCEVPYVRRCSCYQSNPVHVARLEQARKYHAEEPNRKRFRS